MPIGSGRDCRRRKVSSAELPLLLGSTAASGSIHDEEEIYRKTNGYHD